MLTRRILAVAAGTLAMLPVAGCHVDTHKDGDSNNVKITTPFGGLQVKTNDATALDDIGLPAYPGAEVVKKHNDGAADVNMSFGSFQLRVKAATFRTADSPDKVMVFYRDGMKRYGDVIECRGNQPVGTPVHTFEGLSCDSKENEGHISMDDKNGKSDAQLKAGSKQHQHIVSIEPEDGGTKFGLVALDLPTHAGPDDRGQ